MTSDASSARESWRRAEAEYVEAITAFLEPPGTESVLDKASLISLVRLRSAADARREEYFLAGEQERGATGSDERRNLAGEWSDS